MFFCRLVWVLRLQTGRRWVAVGPAPHHRLPGLNFCLIHHYWSSIYRALIQVTRVTTSWTLNWNIAIDLWTVTLSWSPWHLTTPSKNSSYCSFCFYSSKNIVICWHKSFLFHRILWEYGGWTFKFPWQLVYKRFWSQN